MGSSDNIVACKIITKGNCSTVMNQFIQNSNDIAANRRYTEVLKDNFDDVYQVNKEGLNVYPVCSSILNSVKVIYVLGKPNCTAILGEQEHKMTDA